MHHLDKKHALNKFFTRAWNEVIDLENLLYNSRKKSI